MEKQLYQAMASAISARQNCIDVNNQEWIERWEADIQKYIGMLPHGSGLDYDWKIDFNKSHANKIILYMSFHAMDDNGYYDGVIDFSLIITPSLISGLNLHIRGNFSNRQDIKEYLYDILHESLTNIVNK